MPYMAMIDSRKNLILAEKKANTGRQWCVHQAASGVGCWREGAHMCVSSTPSAYESPSLTGFLFGVAPSCGMAVLQLLGVHEVAGKANSVTVFLSDDCRPWSMARLPTRPTVGAAGAMVLRASDNRGHQC